MSNNEQREDLSAEIRRLMQPRSGEEESNITAIVTLMEQLNRELRNLRPQSPPTISHPIQEESRDNIHHELHTSTECSSPSPEWNILEYYVIVDECAPHGSGGSAMLLEPPRNAEK